MAEQKQPVNQQASVSKIDALYSWISYDLQKLKKELLSEMKYSSVQIGSLYGEIKGDREKSSQAITQEIRYSYIQNQNIYDGLSTLLADSVAKVDEVIGRLDAFASDTLAEGVKEKVAGILPPIEATLNEIRFSYLQQQSIYESLKKLINTDVVSKMDEVYARFSLIEQMDSALEEIRQKVADFMETVESDSNKKLVENIVAAIPVAENVDYTRIADEVGDKMLEVLGDVLVPQKEKEEKEVNAKIDYDKIIYGTTEKIIESLPYPDKVDYRRIDQSFAKSAEKVQVNVSEDVISKAVSLAVEKVLASLDVDAIATKVAEKIQIPAPEVPQIDYDKLSDMVAEKLSANVDQTYDVVLDQTGIDEIADRLVEKVGQSETVDYARISAIIDEKLAQEPTEEETTFDFVIDDEGIDAIATSVSMKLCEMCANCEDAPVEETVEETVEEIVEETPVETVEEIVEEVIEETVETVEEAPVEEAPAEEEIAVAEEKEVVYEEVGGELVDAETGMIIRLKKSFTAKMKQSEEDVKKYYSDLKNALLGYKKIRSNISWHGDRFNFGRETVAKMGINGKTLCFYLALDPNDEEFKETVYHQKNVGDQRAHESTPFLVKVKSGAAVKKALRLVEALAKKIGAEQSANVEEVNYADEFAYESIKQLLSEGHIKLTKEKKVEFNF